jgi:hypothetical protein
VVVQSSDGTTVGALTGPDIPYGYLCWGGVCEYRTARSISSATTTPCSIQSPNATSTIEFASFNITTATSSVLAMDLATSTNAFASTTVLHSYTAIASAKGVWTFVASTTSTLLALDSEKIVLPPKTWLVWKGAAATTYPYFTVVGGCQAGFRAMPR